MSAERKRLKEDKLGSKQWKKWGPYLPDRQWSTVREDYSADGNCWNYFPHDDARSRVFRWGEDGLLGITDKQCRLCMALSLWNGRDPILKERLFGLTGLEGNHGEDVKELYYYLDSTPTHSYMRALYKYPQKAYPYDNIVAENRRRTVFDPEYELLDTGVFDEGDYWDIEVEYCKNTPNDILARYTIYNRGKMPDTIHVMPILWFRNIWSWGDACDAYCSTKPQMSQEKINRVLCRHESLGDYCLEADVGPGGHFPEILFTDNETNYERLYNQQNKHKYVKDAFHYYIMHRKKNAVNNHKVGTKCGAYYVIRVDGHDSVTLNLRLYSREDPPPVVFGPDAYDRIFRLRRYECDQYYMEVIPNLNPVERNVARQAYAGLLWSKQFYHYVIKEWLEGDKGHPTPPSSRLAGRNHDWLHLFNRDIISVPDKWEYPWYASWDLAFHCIAYANVDIQFAKDQLLLFLREWYMHPNGQIPAYEFAFDDVNPPVHAYAALRVYKASGPKGHRDTTFLARCFHKLVLNFTWWVNRKDPDGKNIFTGGFLGLDNIGVFDRSKPLPSGGKLLQADATGWMAFFSVIMLQISLILSRRDPIYDDMSSKFFEHFISIVDTMNRLAGEGLWDEVDGFYYDNLLLDDGSSIPLKIRSWVGMIPMFLCFVISESELKQHPGFQKRMKLFLKHREELKSRISFMRQGEGSDEERMMLSICTADKLRRMLRYILDEEEFLSPYGIRSLSKVHLHQPFYFDIDGKRHSVSYQPGESRETMFGGNSNWRGPIWLCMNYIMVENLDRLDFFYGEEFKVECPVRSGNFIRLSDVAKELANRLSRLFLPDADGCRPCHGMSERYAKDPNFKDLVLFYEYFDGDTGRGCGASHQTGWSALAVEFLKSFHRYSMFSRSNSSFVSSSDEEGQSRTRLVSQDSRESN
ncbi:uncharacterized protein YMR196W-like [Gigantopelta aegis]|uniref:uncharacterized protein YMR196W-like n=1 Tax=Gigantopelta aegis TaxID=1735272 RepID=UPI001B88C881|nr:uncharacterized protein YMR196W-like [Gigantopelta aegis]